MTGFGMVNPHENFHQGGFAGAVFPQQNMDFSRLKIKGDII
jgi:hypothetical protein